MLLYKFVSSTFRVVNQRLTNRRVHLEKMSLLFLGSILGSVFLGCEFLTPSRRLSRKGSRVVPLKVRSNLKREEGASLKSFGGFDGEISAGENKKDAIKKQDGSVSCSLLNTITKAATKYPTDGEDSLEKVSVSLNDGATYGKEESVDIVEPVVANSEPSVGKVSGFSNDSASSEKEGFMHNTAAGRKSRSSTPSSFSKEREYSAAYIPNREEESSSPSPSTSTTVSGESQSQPVSFTLDFQRDGFKVKEECPSDDGLDEVPLDNNTGEEKESMMELELSSRDNLDTPGDSGDGDVENRSSISEEYAKQSSVTTQNQRQMIQSNTEENKENNSAKRNRRNRRNKTLQEKEESDKPV